MSTSKYHFSRKMSEYNKKPPAMLSQHQVNKRILAKEDRQRLEYELLQFNNKYRDENFEIYQRKKKEFLETAKRYHDLNKLAMSTNKKKLEQSYHELTFPFTYNEFETKNPIDCDNGELLRKRHERKIHEQTEVHVDVCTIEPWFKRYLSLGKFIQAARTIILKNRLLKNLEMLKLVNDENIAEYETDSKICDNVSYQELFQKFLIAEPGTHKPSWIPPEGEGEVLQDGALSEVQEQNSVQ